MTGSELVTTVELAARLGVAQSTVDGWTRRYSDFPAPRASGGRVRLYDAGEVEAWFAAHDPRPGRREIS